MLPCAVCLTEIVAYKAVVDYVRICLSKEVQRMYGKKRCGEQIDETKKYIKGFGSAEVKQVWTRAVNGVGTPDDDGEWVELEYKYKIMLSRAWSQTDTGSDLS
jgi:hypothetical protein